MYGEKVTPNQHQLARDYVLLDNLYCNSEVSVDGHSWSDAAIATDFNQRSWIISYSEHGKLPGNEEMEIPAAGYLWDLCRRHGLSYKNYGEGAQRVPSANRGRWNSGDGRDMDRVQILDRRPARRRDSRASCRGSRSCRWARTTPRAPRPARTRPRPVSAATTSALGRIVEAATRSKFWKEMAIFVIEDDAQNGPDHVDAHRTAGLVISPYCRRGVVDSTLYTMASMVRTIELILGLPPLTQYDAGATPMFNCFQSDGASYALRRADAQGGSAAQEHPQIALCRAVEPDELHAYDLAPEDELNRILWYVAKGPDVPYPRPIHRALFTTAPQ